ncbi:MAG: PqqD family peptide modification chaperone, partial [Acidobacteriaceae bacterium]|nr:PqqD family peptide modification chaperone [Acidobacteriaceae bacterium]MBV9295668.1 PqqD family peptide modification chaperone [Acidobacteriaceae bacterium]
SDSPGLYILNPTARDAWRLLRSNQPLDQAAAEFAAHYGIPLPQAARDLESTWTQWQQTLLAPAPLSTREAVPLPPPTDLTPATFARNYRLHGKNIRVILHHPDLISDIAPRLEPLLADNGSEPIATLQATATEDGFHVFSGSNWVATEDQPSGARIVLLQEFARSAQDNPDWPVILHAGACGSTDQCVLFPAASQSGKTTLAAALMHAGLMFYTDDSAPLEAGKFAVPVMPFSLMIREGSWPVLLPRFPELAKSPILSHWGQNVRFLSPRNRDYTGSAKVSAIVFSRFERGATTSLQPVDAFETLVALEASGIWVRHCRNSIGKFLQWIEALPSYRLTYSDLDDAVATVRRLLGVQR